MPLKRWVAAAVVAVVACPALASAGAAYAGPGKARGPVVLFAVPDLRWTDVAAMPTLRGLAGRGAVGVLSVRSQGESTRCGDGLLELSAGTRVPSGLVTCAIDAATLDRVRAHYRHGRYDAHVGLLGDHLDGTTAAVGAGAPAVVATSTGPAPPVTPLRQALAAGASLVVIVDTQLYDDPNRADAAASIDRRLAATLQLLPSQATVVVAGVSDGPRGGPHLHPVVITGPGWTHHALVSPTTGRAPYVQLFDLTPTLLSLRGSTDTPDGMSGRAVTVSSTPVRSPSAYVDVDRHARRALTVGHPTFSVLCGVLVAVMLLALVRPAAAAWLARLLVAAPLTAWLLQVAPWWRWPIAAYVAVFAGLCGIGAVVTWWAGRRSRRAAVVVVPAITAAVLLVDQLTGARLQLSAPFGDNPLVAGRFHGMGNIAFGVTMGALLLSVGVLAAGRPRRQGAVLVVVAGVVAVVVDGAPSIGDDIGGILALVPAVALLAALVAGIGVTARRVLPVAVAAVVLATGAALADYARPAASRTHAGRFVADVLDGDAGPTVHRKLDAVLASFATPAVTLLVLVTVVLAVLAWRRRLPITVHFVPGVAAAAVAVAVLAVVGSALNDSGIFVGAAAVLAFVPAVLAASLGDTRRL